MSKDNPQGVPTGGKGLGSREAVRRRHYFQVADPNIVRRRNFEVDSIENGVLVHTDERSVVRKRERYLCFLCIGDDGSPSVLVSK